MTTATITMTVTTTVTTIEEAYNIYADRADRLTNPAGEFDNAGRWYPSEAEHCACCDDVRSPSRAYPYSYMTHCRTIKHVAARTGVDEKELRRYDRLMSREAK